MQIAENGVGEIVESGEKRRQLATATREINSVDRGPGQDRHAENLNEPMTQAVTATNLIPV